MTWMDTIARRLQREPYWDNLRVVMRAWYAGTPSAVVDDELVRMGVPIGVFERWIEKDEPLSGNYRRKVVTWLHMREEKR